MATADSVKTKIQGLISKANAKTGRSDADMTSAVDALISGYGQGGGATPSGTINITSNGTYDVTNYASANVNVPTPAQYSVVRTVTVPSDVTGANNTYTLLSGDDFIKAHYADEGFSAACFPVTPVASETNVVHGNYHGNRNMGSTNLPRYGFGYRSTSASVIAMMPFTKPINSTGYTQHLRVNSNGDLLQYLASGYILKAGTYIIVLTCID